MNIFINRLSNICVIKGPVDAQTDSRSGVMNRAPAWSGGLSEEMHFSIKRGAKEYVEGDFNARNLVLRMDSKTYSGNEEKDPGDF